MEQQGLRMIETKPGPSLFKRNPPIAGEAEAIENAKNGDAEAFSKLTSAAFTPFACACSATSPRPRT